MTPAWYVATLRQFGALGDFLNCAKLGIDLGMPLTEAVRNAWLMWGWFQ